MKPDSNTDPTFEIRRIPLTVIFADSLSGLSAWLWSGTSCR
jgi:hypothetical protein